MSSNESTGSSASSSAPQKTKVVVKTLRASGLPASKAPTNLLHGKAVTGATISALRRASGRSRARKSYRPKRSFKSYSKRYVRRSRPWRAFSRRRYLSRW